MHTKRRNYWPYALALALLWSIAWVCGFGAHDQFSTRGAGLSTGPDPNLHLVLASSVEPVSKRGKYGGIYTDTILGDPKTFNIWVATDNGSFQTAGQLYDTLIAQNPYTLKWEGHLTDLPQISPDGLRWTFRLKPGLQWSDGVPIDADDIIFTLNMIFDPVTQGIMRESMMVDVLNPRTKKFDHQPVKYHKVDSRTVEFDFPVPYAPARSMLSVAIAPRHKLEAAWHAGQINNTWNISTMPSELVASGPWIMQSYVQGQRVMYARNPHYWKKDAWGRALPYLDSYVQVVVPDRNTETLKFGAGECDALEVQATDYPLVKAGEAHGGYTVYDLGPGFGFNYLGFNMNPKAAVDPTLIKLFRNVKFRQAVSYAINRRLMTVNLFRGLAVPGWSPITAANTLYFDPNVQKYPYDPTRAKNLLDDIGVRDNGSGFRNYLGKQVEFNIETNVENDVRKSMCVVITKDLKDVGLNAIFRPVSFNKLITGLDSPPYQWEGCMLGFTGGIEPNDGANIWMSSGPSHQWQPSQSRPATPWEAEIDDLFRRGAQTIDQQKRIKIYNRWQEIAAQQLPFIYTVVPDSLNAIRNRFGNLKPCPQGAVWNMDELYDLSSTRDAP